ncbi:Uncharacterized protein TCM_033525 [Theobroma cacao]|uniref:Uncharacterized protein n=1 Tax=Theobroma cacao TaxID=3641 RepID=A0A061FA84_THECC|nr:Uncharacterized protein TCM_033525 [Theobroma cacao]
MDQTLKFNQIKQINRINAKLKEQFGSWLHKQTKKSYNHDMQNAFCQVQFLAPGKGQDDAIQWHTTTID